MPNTNNRLLTFYYYANCEFMKYIHLFQEELNHLIATINITNKFLLHIPAEF